MNDMQYSIKDLEKLSSIKAHTIRIWEKRYQIIKPERTDTNIRYYDDKELKHLMNISVLIQNGIKISHIARLNSEEIKEKAYFLLQNSGDSDNQIKNLILSMIELNEAKFEKTLNKSILNIGFEKTMIQLIYPFFQQIGIMWQTGSINPAQEHFISALIRQKLIVSVDGLESNLHPKSKRFILFLPEGEMHELGLLFYSYLLKTRGHEVLYLGQSTPINSVIEASLIWNPDYLLLFAVSAFSGISYQSFLNELSSSFSSKNIIVAGSQLSELDAALPANIQNVHNASEFISLINNLSE
jgi:MerR family transcriptional regulator, light-induced transcriptional regulator